MLLAVVPHFYNELFPIHPMAATSYLSSPERWHHLPKVRGTITAAPSFCFWSALTDTQHLLWEFKHYSTLDLRNISSLGSASARWEVPAFPSPPKSSIPESWNTFVSWTDNGCETRTAKSLLVLWTFVSCAWETVLISPEHVLVITFTALGPKWFSVTSNSSSIKV